MPVETEVGLGGGEPDQHRAVDLGCQFNGPEYAADVEPLIVDPDPLTRMHLADAEALGGGGAEDSHWIPGGRGVEIAALGDRGADCRA